MNKETMNRLLFAGLLVFIAMYVFNQPESFGEDEIKAKYYEVLSVMEPLYANHEQSNGLYFNGKLSTTEDIIEYLEPYMTDKAVRKLMEELFQKSGNQLVYTGQFQEYLMQGYSYLPDNQQFNYYGTVKDTVFNPGLKLVMENQISVMDNGEEIILIVEDETVNFYNDTYENLHFTRYGYPEKAVINVTFTFNEMGGNLLLTDFHVITNEEYSS